MRGKQTSRQKVGTVCAGIKPGKFARLAEIGVRLGEMKGLCSLSLRTHGTVRPSISYEYIGAG